jgi:hypothetical protein|tara:strand:+ start:359 stop:559 length:201 start_codon:yes stop_codon:yes gene_type:complete
MKNKTLAAINLTCIGFPIVLGLIEELTGNSLKNTLVLGFSGLLMIVFGIWTSIRLGKQPDSRLEFK